MSPYTTPDSLVETSWLVEHLNDPESASSATKTSFFMELGTSQRRPYRLAGGPGRSDQRDYITPEALLEASRTQWHFARDGGDFLWK
jgi:hypothetical protein